MSAIYIIILILALFGGMGLRYWMDRLAYREKESIVALRKQLDAQKKKHAEKMRENVFELIEKAEKIPGLKGQFDNQKAQLNAGCDTEIVLIIFYEVAALTYVRLLSKSYENIRALEGK